MPATLYPSVTILQDGGKMGIEIDYPPDPLVRWDTLFRDTGIGCKYRFA